MNTYPAVGTPVSQACPELTSLVVVKKDGPWQVPIHAHDDCMEIILVLNGMGTLSYAKETVPLEIGDLRIYNQGFIHGEVADATFPMEEICITIRGVQIGGMPPNCILPTDGMPVLKTAERFPLFYALFQMLADNFSKEEAIYRQLCRESTTLILTLVQELILHSVQRRRPDSSSRFPIAREIVDFLDRNYRQNILLKDLEDKFHFSQYYLARKFKEEIGCTINEYITNRRIGEAGRLLIYTDLTISEIAQLVGYDNLSHFSSAFKKRIGISPGRIKEFHQRKR